MYVDETVIDDPLLRLIEWHSGGAPKQSSDPTPPLDTENAIEAALVEWHDGEPWPTRCDPQAADATTARRSAS